MERKRENEKKSPAVRRSNNEIISGNWEVF